jgi:hypothetical protein
MRKKDDQGRALWDLAEAYAAYLRERGYPAGTIRTYDQHLRGFLLWLGNRPPAALETLRDYGRHIDAEEYTEPGRRAICAALGLFFVWRVEAGVSRELPDVSRFFHPEDSRRGIMLPENRPRPAPPARTQPEPCRDDSSPWEKIASAADRLDRTRRGELVRA